jgi:hypothetical protein
MKIVLPVILIVIALLSCRVPKSNKITAAYVNCVSGDSVRVNTDSLKYFFHHARGKLQPGFLAKGASKVKMEYKNGRRRTIQIIWGHQTIFHFSGGIKKNVWYTFKDTLIDQQWHSFFNRTMNACKNQ